MWAILLIAAGLSAQDREDLVAVHCFDVAVHGDLAYLAQTDGLTVSNIGDPVHAERLARVELPASILGVTVHDGRVYLAAGSLGMLTLDVSSLPDPKLVRRVDTPGSVHQVAVSGSVAFLADDIQGLTIVDLSIEGRPKILATIPTRSAVRAVALDGELLATAEGTAGARVFDVSNPSAPRERAVVHGLGNVQDVAIRGTQLFVAAERSIKNRACSWSTPSVSISR